MNFPFNDETHFGLLSFFKDTPIKTRNEVFTLYGHSFSERCLLTNLIKWDQKAFLSKSVNGFTVKFTYPWVFQLSGYRLKGSSVNWLHDWEITGFFTDYERSINLNYAILEEKKIVLPAYSEQSFRVRIGNFYDAIKFYNESDVSLSAIELFGFLRKD